MLLVKYENIKIVSVLLIFILIAFLGGIFSIAAASDERIYIEEGKVGDISIGMDVSGLIKKYPSRFKKTSVAREGEDSPAFIYKFNNGKSIRFEVHEERGAKFVWFITVEDPYFKTRKGIGVGNTFKEVKRAYSNAKFYAGMGEGEHIGLNEEGFWFGFDISQVKRNWWLQEEKDMKAVQNIKVKLVNIVR